VLELSLTNVAGRATLSDDAPAGTAGGAGGSAGGKAPLYVFSAGEKVSGQCNVTVPTGKKVEHLGVKVELKGLVGECAGVEGPLPRCAHAASD